MSFSNSKDGGSRPLTGMRSGAPACAGLALAAILIQGYHLGTDDAAIWVPAIKKAADPSLYPFGGEFFLTHAHVSLFPLLLGSFARLTRMPSDVAILLCHILGVFLLLLASRRLLSACFHNERARWAGVALLAGVLSVPVAGTAIPIMDPYVTSRSLSTPLALFAIAWYLSERPRRAIACLAACALLHPQMSLYAAALLGTMELSRRRAAVPEAVPAFGLLALSWVPLPWDLAPARGAARAALVARTYFFVSNWTWYEWLGVAAPLLLLGCCARFPLRGARPPLAGLLRNLVRFGLLFTAAGLLLASSPRFENYTRLQPMRAFQLVYIVSFPDSRRSRRRVRAEGPALALVRAVRARWPRVCGWSRGVYSPAARTWNGRARPRVAIGIPLSSGCAITRPKTLFLPWIPATCSCPEKTCTAFGPWRSGAFWPIG